jgi:hypothetical protein
MILWYCGTKVLWYKGTMVQRYYGTKVLWYYGTKVLWYKGTMVQRYYGIMYFLLFQLVSSLSKEAVHVSIDLIRVPNVGWCLRFNPLVHAASKS